MRGDHLRRCPPWNQPLGYRHAAPATPGQATKETTMPSNAPTPDHQRPGRPFAPDTAATASPAPGSADLVHGRQLEKSVSWTGRERLRCLWYRLRLTISEMNYASRRMVELQMRLPSQWPAAPPPTPKRDLRFHALRHTYATLLLDLGAPPHVVQEIVGHSDIEVTMTIYAHVSPDENARHSASSCLVTHLVTRHRLAGGCFWVACLVNWSGWPDLNRRPLRPERSALPSCATPRRPHQIPVPGEPWTV